MKLVRDIDKRKERQKVKMVRRQNFEVAGSQFSTFPNERTDIGMGMGIGIGIGYFWRLSQRLLSRVMTDFILSIKTVIKQKFDQSHELCACQL